MLSKWGILALDKGLELCRVEESMHKKVRYHRIRLYPYAITAMSHWSLPPISPSPILNSPHTPHRSAKTASSRQRRSQYRKITLVPVTPEIAYRPLLLEVKRTLESV